MAASVIVAAGALCLVLIGLLASLLGSLRRTGEAVEALGSRLDELEGRTGDLRGELAAVDDGLTDVAAALREHRVPDGEPAAPTGRESDT